MSQCRSLNVSPIISLAEASRCPKAGEKAAGLARLIAGGFRVPEGFVISADCYRAHLWASGARPLASGAANAQERVRIRDAILSTQIPPDVWQAILDAYQRLCQAAGSKVAVRASAVEGGRRQISYPGAYETYLDVADAETLQAAVKGVWASLWSDKAAEYRAGLPGQDDALGPGIVSRTKMTEPAMAVIVQRMVEADLSGTAATASTVTGDPNKVLVSVQPPGGAAEPWHCEFDLTSCRISGNPPALLPAEIAAERAVLIENLFGGPVAIEWLSDKTGLWLVQARLLTDLPPFFPVPLLSEYPGCAEWRLACSRPVSHLSRCLLPDSSCAGALVTHGRVYVPIPGSGVAGRDGKLVSDWKNRAARELRSRIRLVPISGLASADHACLLDALNQAVQIVRSAAGWLHDLAGASLRFRQLLHDYLSGLLARDDVDSLHATLMSGLMDAAVIRQAQVQDFAARAAAARDSGMMDDSQWRASFALEIAEFIAANGYSYRSTDELYDPATWKSWWEDPEQVFQMIRAEGDLGDGETLLTRQCADQVSAVEVAHRIAESLKKRERKRFAQVLHAARTLEQQYQEAESIHALACTVFRVVLAELAGRLVDCGLIREKSDVFYLTLDDALSLPSEPDEADRKRAAVIVARRKHELWLEQRLAAPEVLQANTRGKNYLSP